MTDTTTNGTAPEIFDAQEEMAKAAVDFPPLVFKDLDGIRRELPNPMLLPTPALQEFDRLMRGTNAAAAEVDLDDDSPEALAAQAAAAQASFDAYVALMDLLEEQFGEAGAAVRAMPQALVWSLLNRWQGVVPETGKSVSPPSPRNREERRSQRTSPPGAKTSTSSRSAKSRGSSKS